MTTDLVSFASDNTAGAHDDVLEAVRAANVGTAPAYGADPWTAKAEALFRREFGDRLQGALPVFNGTGANVVALSTALRSFEAVLTAEKAHIAVDEAGAPEKFGGFKLFPIATPDQKLSPAALEARIQRRGDVHYSQARAVSITQSTEYGTVYSLAELRALAEACERLGLYRHLDGARLANAAASLGVSMGEVVDAFRADLVSFGATKNGCLGAEAILVFNPALAPALPHLRKQAMQLASKMRFVSAQLVAYLEGGLWRRNAEHANGMARRLGDGVFGSGGADGVIRTQATEANAVFARLPRERIERLQKEFYFYVWDESPSRPGGADAEVRWMTHFQSREADVDRFVRAIRGPG